jgi:hypothetical protein
MGLSWNYVLTKKNSSAWRLINASAALYTTNPILTILLLNLDLSWQKPPGAQLNRSNEKNKFWLGIQKILK